MPNSRLNRLFTIITWLLVLALLIGAAFLWSDELIYFVTGQDIIDDLDVDVAAYPSATPVPTATSEPAPGATFTPASGDSAGDTSSLIDNSPLLRQHVLKYIVQPGDALFLIAQNFNLNPNTIFWANTDTLQDNIHLLYVGTKLYILPVDGVYHTSDGLMSIEQIAEQYTVSPQSILDSPYNNLPGYAVDDAPPAGLRIVVPNGTRDYISWQSPIRTGLTSGAANPEGSLHPGSCTGNYIGSGGSGNYINPVGTASYYVTNEFARWHAGIDLAAEEDTSIYASETGVVVFAGWHQTSYGELVIIDHGQGWTTFYAHLSDRFVECGEQVSKGQILGLMGTTGMSTGIHLHFEIRHEDFAIDPRTYVDFDAPVILEGG